MTGFFPWSTPFILSKVIVAKFLLILITLFGGIIEPIAAQKNQHWRIVQKYLQKDVRILHSDPSLLIISKPSLKDTIRIGLTPCSTCDITGSLEKKRGDNPYRVWVAHDGFWNNDKRPQSTWGQYFRSSFLRILRPPPG